MTVADLFNLDRALTPQERRRLRAGTTAKGYAALPGTGPAGETCGSCQHLVRRAMGKVYLKCGLMQRCWTRGPGSDVRAKSPACSRWGRSLEEPARSPAKPARAPRKPPKAARAPEPLPPPTMRERADAAIAARALRAALVDPSTRGDERTAHIDYSRPRRGEWITSWANLPGFTCVNGAYHHRLMPGWQYTRAEVAAEMIPDLELLAERGERPTEATSTVAGP